MDEGDYESFCECGWEAGQSGFQAEGCGGGEEVFVRGGGFGDYQEMDYYDEVLCRRGVRRRAFS